ncbi:hypothetical protein GCM10012276_26340 [Nocardioides deserti]|nr:hypothetical protein GCM10012276_26340 [Nocardioides deserti]
MLWAPAAVASIPDAGGGTCSRSVSSSKPTTSTVKYTWTIKCPHGVSYIYHGMTLQGPPGVTTNSGACRSLAGNLTSCTKSITISGDKAGQQKYQGIDEWCVGWDPNAVTCMVSGTWGPISYYR